MHMLYINYMVLFTLVDLQSQCTGQVFKPVLERCLKVLKLVNDKRGGTLCSL